MRRRVPGLLGPLPDHVQRILGTAAGNETVARRFANGFSDPSDFDTWFVSPELADAYLAAVAGEAVAYATPGR